MIDTSYIGHVTDPYAVTVEKGRLRDFARATGQSDRVYLDEEAAKAAGYRGLLAPPTTCSRWIWTAKIRSISSRS